MMLRISIRAASWAVRICGIATIASVIAMFMRTSRVSKASICSPMSRNAENCTGSGG